MSSIGTTSQLGERVRAAVACFRAAEGSSGKVYVLLETPESDTRQTHMKRLAVRRLYAGEHKKLEGRWTVIIGLDLSEPTPTPVSIPAHHRTYEVVVRGTSFAHTDLPFEGIFELKGVEVP